MEEEVLTRAEHRSVEGVEEEVLRRALYRTKGGGGGGGISTKKGSL